MVRRPAAIELDQLILTLSRDLGITVVIVTHELPSIFLVCNTCIVLDKAAKGIVARGDPRTLRDSSDIPFVRDFFTRSSPAAAASHGGAELGESATCIQQMIDFAIAPRLRARVIGNPVTGEGYLLLDIPTNPPPPPALGFTPSRGYVPSMPSPLAALQDRLPVILERAEQSLQTLTRVVARSPTAWTGLTGSSPASNASSARASCRN